MAITLGTRLYTWLRGEEVGRDDFGNRYYREKGGGNVLLSRTTLEAHPFAKDRRDQFFPVFAQRGSNKVG